MKAKAQKFKGKFNQGLLGVLDQVFLLDQGEIDLRPKNWKKPKFQFYQGTEENPRISPNSQTKAKRKKNLLRDNPTF